MGRAIAAALGWDVESAEAKKLIKELINDWVRSGVFRVEIPKDKRSHDREYVVLDGAELL